MQKHKCFTHWKVRKRPCAHNSVSVLSRQRTVGFAQKAVNNLPNRYVGQGII